MADKIYVGDKLISAAYVGDMKVYEEVTPVFTINITSAHCTYSGISILNKGESGTITIVPEDGYFIRSYDIIVDGADYSFDNINYILTISNPYKNVNVTIECLELYLHLHCDNKFSITKNTNFDFEGTFEYSTDKVNWNACTGNTKEVLATSINDIYFRGTGNTTIGAKNTSLPATKLSTFTFNRNDIDLYGCIESVVNYQKVKINGYIGPNKSTYAVISAFFFKCNIRYANNLIFTKDIETTKCRYDYLFYLSTIIKSPELPSKTLSTSCYSCMFLNCKNLVYGPTELPATTIKTSSYMAMFSGCSALLSTPYILANSVGSKGCQSMFENCTSLTTVRSLSATTLNENCYEYMFRCCINLENCFSELLASNVPQYAYNYMFNGCSKLKTAPEIKATILGAYSCNGMFYGCESLVSAPIIRATTFGQKCCYEMFYNCTSLSTAPDLLATTLGESCCEEMFRGCTSLTTTPALPAESLAKYCYSSMFYDCTSLTTISTISAKSLAQYCYQEMFYRCSSLTTPPSLPLTDAFSCYYRMFEGCISLNKLPALPTKRLYGRCYERMFQGCTSIKLSTTQNSEYTTPYMVPSDGEGFYDSATNSLNDMFSNTGGTFAGTPTLNTTYYTANEII